MSVPAAYIGIILIWSTTPLAIQWSSQEVGFIFGLTARMILGLAVCLGLMLVLRVRFVWHRRALQSYVASGVSLYGAMMCVYWGAQYISSGLVSVVYGLLPLVTTVLTALWMRQSVWQPAKLIGVMLGLVGLIVIFNPSDGFHAATLLGVSGVLGSVAIHAISMIMIKEIGVEVPALSMTTGGLTVAVPLYLTSWWMIDGRLPEEVPLQVGLAIVYLGIVGVAGFVLFYYILKRISPDAIAVSTLITPVIALSIGHLLNHEALQAQILFGAGLILLGLMTHHWGNSWLKKIALRAS